LQAQFRSSLTCPACLRQSNTFDPFFCVSLPIPQRTLRALIATVLYLDQSPRQAGVGKNPAQWVFLGFLGFFGFFGFF
jgi:ubiquitin carboxyl-terminal hydrolase 31